MTNADTNLLASILGHLADGCREAAITQAQELEATYLAEGLYLLALELWKRILEEDPHCAHAHLKLIALQEHLGLAAEVQVQRRMLEQACRAQELSPEKLERIKAQLGLVDPEERP